MVPCDTCKKDRAFVSVYTDSQGGCADLCDECSADLLDYLIGNMTGAQFRKALESFRADQDTQAPLVPGKAGTVPADRLSTFAMGDGAGKECRVVHGGWVKLYVGIGWIKEREAKQEDCDSFPLVV